MIEFRFGSYSEHHLVTKSIGPRLCSSIDLDYNEKISLQNRKKMGVNICFLLNPIIECHGIMWQFEFPKFLLFYSLSFLQINEPFPPWIF